MADQLVAPDKTFVCRICKNVDFENSEALRLHFKEDHKQINFIMKEQMCLKCALCKCEFRTTTNFYRHCTPEVKVTHKCGKCRTNTFPSKCLKTLHQLNYHQLKPVETNVDTKIDLIVADAETEVNPSMEPEMEADDSPVGPEVDAISKLSMISTGFFDMKNQIASLEFRLIQENINLAKALLLPMQALKITGKVNLESENLSLFCTKMLQASASGSERCVVLALPTGENFNDLELQSRNLKLNFVQYLQEKNAAGRIYFPDTVFAEHRGYVAHIFPSCQFINKLLNAINPNLLAKLAEMEYLVVIMTKTY